MKPSTSWELMSGFLLAALPSGSSSHGEQGPKTTEHFGFRGSPPAGWQGA